MFSHSSAPERVSERLFNRNRAAAGYPNLKAAHKLCEQLGMSWHIFGGCDAALLAAGLDLGQLRGLRSSPKASRFGRFSSGVLSYTAPLRIAVRPSCLRGRREDPIPAPRSPLGGLRGRATIAPCRARPLDTGGFAPAEAGAELRRTRAQSNPTARDVAWPSAHRWGTPDWTREECVEAFIRFLDDLPAGWSAGRTTTSSGRPAEMIEPWTKAFERHGGFAAIRGEAREERRRRLIQERENRITR